MFAASLILKLKSWVDAHQLGVTLGTLILVLLGTVSTIYKGSRDQQPETRHAHELAAAITVARPYLVKEVFVKAGTRTIPCKFDARLLTPATEDGNCSAWIGVPVKVARTLRSRSGSAMGRSTRWLGPH